MNFNGEFFCGLDWLNILKENVEMVCDDIRPFTPGYHLHQVSWEKNKIISFLCLLPLNNISRSLMYVIKILKDLF